MDQSVATTAQKMIESPINAWLAIVPILFICIVIGVLLFCYKLWDKSSTESAKREERLTGIIDTSLAQHGQTIAKQTDTLTNVNSSLLSMKDIICDVKDRVEDIEEKIGITKGSDMP